MLPITSTYVKRFNGGNKWINILAKDDELLKIIYTWNKVNKIELLKVLKSIKIFKTY